MNPILFSIAFTFSMFMLVDSECCGRTAMYWAADSCYPYREYLYMPTNNEYDLMASMMLPTYCIAKVCGDGRVHSGFYCGIGPCNAFGCNCKGGCIKGDAQANFRRISGTNADAGFATFDPTTWGKK